MADRLVMKPTEVAEALDCSKTTVYELIHSGQLPSVRIGKDMRVPVAGVQQFIDKQLKSRK